MSTPAHIATALRAAGWRPDGEDWIRPGAHPDRHSYPVADLVQRTNEPHYSPPPAVEPKPPRPGFQMRGSNRPARLRVRAESPSTRPPGQPRKADLIRRVVELRGEGKTFAAIAKEIGGKPSRIYYLAAQASKLPAAA